MSRKITFKDEEIKDIINDYSNNYVPTMNIAKKYSVDSCVIKRVLNENGIEVKNGSAFSKKYWIERGLSDEESELKISEMKPCYLNYWTSRGFTEDEGKLKVELHLMNTERSFIEKYGEEIGKIKYQEQRNINSRGNSKRSIEYWLKRGFTEKDSKIKVSESQKTYSKEIFIEKYGEKEGIDLMNERNRKWLEKLKNNPNYNDFQKKKDARSINHYIEKYNENFIEEFVNKFCNFDIKIKDIIINYLKENKYLEFITLIKENYDYDIKKFKSISNYKIVQHCFNKTYDEIKNDILKQYPIKNKNSWGTTYVIDGIILRSLGETEIYNFLNSLKINFKYDKTYPFQNERKYKYDFYIIDKDLYIEYTGMENLRKTDETKKILDKYDKTIKIKRLHCIENNLKHYFSNSSEDIKKFIKKLYE